MPLHFRTPHIKHDSSLTSIVPKMPIYESSPSKKPLPETFYQVTKTITETREDFEMQDGSIFNYERVNPYMEHLY